MPVLPEWIAKYWVEWAFGLIVAALTCVVRTLSARIKRQQVENEALRNGMRALLMRQIEQDCEDAIRAGHCSAQSKSTIATMYESYHALGGNGVITGLVDQLLKLPPE